VELRKQGFSQAIRRPLTNSAGSSALNCLRDQAVYQRHDDLDDSLTHGLVPDHGADTTALGRPNPANRLCVDWLKNE